MQARLIEFMNTVLTFLTENRRRLQLQAYGAPSRWSCVWMTPRFKASSHLILFILSENRSQPFLVVKVPRLPGDHRRLDREVENLRRVHTLKPSGFESIPSVIAYEDYLEHRLLVETALPFDTMRQSTVRKMPESCLQTGLGWLLDLHLISRTKTEADRTWFERLIQRPLQNLNAAVPLSAAEKTLLQKTRTITNTLWNDTLPLVFEHGDFSAPNILFAAPDQIAVVDWELAEPRGLPAADLFFFLTYLAFARKTARKRTHYLAAFHNAFWGANAWAKPHIQKYGHALQISAKQLKPLFVLCWCRYVAGLAMRLHQQESDPTRMSATTADWLRHNRYFALWQHAVEYFEELDFREAR